MVLLQGDVATTQTGEEFGRLTLRAACQRRGHDDDQSSIPDHRISPDRRVRTLGAQASDSMAPAIAPEVEGPPGSTYRNRGPPVGSDFHQLASLVEGVGQLDRRETGGAGYQDQV